MVQLSQLLIPLISGSIYVMSNPMLKSTEKIVESAQRAFHIRIFSNESLHIDLARHCKSLSTTESRFRYEKTLYQGSLDLGGT